MRSLIGPCHRVFKHVQVFSVNTTINTAHPGSSRFPGFTSVAFFTRRAPLRACVKAGMMLFVSGPSSPVFFIRQP